MNIRPTIIAAFLACGAVALAAPNSAPQFGPMPLNGPTTAPSTQPDGERQFPRRMSGGRGAGRMDDETRWPEAAKMMQEFSPERYKAYDEMPDGPKKTAVRASIIMRYNITKRMENSDDPTLLDLVKKRLTLEDKIWVLSKNFKAASDADKPAIQNDLHDRVTELVKLGLDERKARIEQFRKFLDSEIQKLDVDTNNQTKLVDEQVQRAIEQGGEFPDQPQDTGPDRPHRGDRPDRGGNRPPGGGGGGMDRGMIPPTPQ